MDGNLCDFLSRNIDHVGELFVGGVYIFTCLCPLWKGHIQIAQVPYRHEPDEQGEINFPFVFQTLRSLGYRGWIGCEYIPRGQLDVLYSGNICDSRGNIWPLGRIPPRGPPAPLNYTTAVNGGIGYIPRCRFCVIYTTEGWLPEAV